MTRLDSWQLSAGHVDLTRPVPTDTRATIDAQPQRLTLDLNRTAFMVIDLQNDFCHPDGWLAGIGGDIGRAAAAVPVVRDLLPSIRSSAMPVIWVNWGNRADRANLPPNVLHVYDPDGTGGGIGEPATVRSTAVLTQGSWGAAVVDDLDPEPGDIRIDKYRMSGFWDTPLDSVLRGLGVHTILFAGVNADQCVLSTLTDAACLGYDCVLVEGAATTSSPDYCLQATLYNVRTCFGFTTTADALSHALERREAPEGMKP